MEIYLLHCESVDQGDRTDSVLVFSSLEKAQAKIHAFLENAKENHPENEGWEFYDITPNSYFIGKQYEYTTNYEYVWIEEEKLR